MLVVGLTGGIGSGKTTVAELFAAHGVPVVDTDALARELVHPGEPAHADIAREFGADVLDATGALDRAKMRALVFKNPLERKRLEAILHPRIREATRRRLAALRAPYAIVAVPLLVETGFDDLVDRILVVDCDERLQVTRVAARNGMSEAEIRQVMAAQTSRQQRLAHADEVLENDADLTQLQRNVDRLHKHYLSLASA